MSNSTSGPDCWDPQQYERFRSERSQPFFDLADLLQPLHAAPGAALRAIDLGCGTGELTRLLYGRLSEQTAGQLQMLGLDASASMLERAGAHATPGLAFQHGSIEDFANAEAEPAPDAVHEPGWDLIFSNAALQWVDQHERLLPAIASHLAPGGQLAIQVPCNDTHPAYGLAADIARSPEFAPALAGYVRETPVMPPEWYAELFHRLGFSRWTARINVYSHLLADRMGVLEWVKGTLLNYYTSRLDEQLASRFVQEYAARLPAVLPDDQPYLFTFKRLFLWARLPEQGADHS